MRYYATFFCAAHVGGGKLKCPGRIGIDKTEYQYYKYPERRKFPTCPICGGIMSLRDPIAINVLKKML